MLRIRATVQDDLAAIGEIYAHHVTAGRGIGGRLLDALLADCAEAGVREVIAVIVDADGAASLALHRNRGSVDAGRLTAVGFEHGRWLDTVLLQRSLTGPGIEDSSCKPGSVPRGGHKPGKPGPGHR